MVRFLDIALQVSAVEATANNEETDRRDDGEHTVAECEKSELSAKSLPEVEQRRAEAVAALYDELARFAGMDGEGFATCPACEGGGCRACDYFGRVAVLH